MDQDLTNDLPQTSLDELAKLSAHETKQLSPPVLQRQTNQPLWSASVTGLVSASLHFANVRKVSQVVAALAQLGVTVLDLFEESEVDDQDE